MLRISRKGHSRKAHIKRQHGKIVGIPGTHVKPTVYLAKDMGKPGRTPKSKQWYNGKEKEIVLPGYKTSLPEKERQAIIRKVDAKPDITSANVYHKLLGLSNVQQRTNPLASKVFKKDAEWTKQHLLNKQERLKMTAPARKKWRGMSSSARAKSMPGGET